MIPLEKVTSMQSLLPAAVYWGLGEAPTVEGDTEGPVGGDTEGPVGGDTAGPAGGDTAGPAGGDTAGPVENAEEQFHQYQQNQFSCYYLHYRNDPVCQPYLRQQLSMY